MSGQKCENIVSLVIPLIVEQPNVGLVEPGMLLEGERIGLPMR